MLAGIKAVVRWQVSQLNVVGMCVAGLPFALTPWQVAQEPGATLAWLNAAPAKLLVDLWQVSQVAEVGICPAFLSLAVIPLWQLAQPATMPV